MNGPDAVDAARAILNSPDVKAEQRRLDRIAEAMRPNGVRVVLPSNPPPAMMDLAARSSTNYLPLILDSITQGMIVDGYRRKGASDNLDAWTAWQLNKLDARQSGIHRSTLKYGTAYGRVTPGDSAAVMRYFSPRDMTAMYGEDDDDFPVLALLRIAQPGNSRHLRLYDETSVYYLGDESGNADGSGIRYIEKRDHDAGVTPIVRFRDRMLLEDEEQLGIIEPILALQQRIDETVFGLMVTQYFQAFKQRYIIGWEPATEADKLNARASDLWTFDDENVKVGSLDQADLNGYLESKDSAVRDMAAISQVPPQQLAVGAIANLSADALAGLEAGKDRMVREIETSTGESHEQMLGLADIYEGRTPDPTAQVRWADATARSFAQTVDGLGKLATMLGVPVQALWERVPGTSETDLAEWKKIAATQNPLGDLAALLDRQAQPNG